MKILSAVISVFMILLSGCAKDPFSTRHSQAPYGATGTWDTPQTPDIVIKNLTNAYNEMILANYQLCFSDSFRFSAPEDSIDAVNNGHGELFSNWNKQTELAVTNNIISTFKNNDSTSFLLFVNPVPGVNDLIGDSLATLYRNYTLVLTVRHSGSTDTTKAEGRAKFDLVQEQLNWWTINFWGDIPIQAGSYDWGDFKASYR